MHQTGISPQTLSTLQTICHLSFVKKYYLAGGTACALHLGHRLSFDLDFFTKTPATPQEIRNTLLTTGSLEIYQNETGTFNGSLNDTKISFFIYPYPLIHKLDVFENVAIASQADLICMKLESVASRGVKRDFIDLYYLLLQVGLTQAMTWFEEKYAGQNVSIAHVLKSLTYFADAESEPMPNMLLATNW
ncbi:MAG: nucleotidyl transferase AbiEii/AbiGii toxin family protein, partial [Patescibacteria group bacterium]